MIYLSNIVILGKQILPYTTTLYTCPMWIGECFDLNYLCTKHKERIEVLSLLNDYAEF